MATPTSSGTTGTEGTYCFLCEWNDTQAQIVRKYHLFYFVSDQTIEMFDIKNRRTFLKRTSYPSITLKDLFLGNQITVYSRQLKLLSYGDDYTRSRLEEVKGRTLAIIKGESVIHVGKTIDYIYRNNFTIGSLRLCKLTSQQSSEFFGEKK
jgi:nucleoside-diphosphate kinase